MHRPERKRPMGGAPAEQKLYSRLRSTDDAARIWAVSEELTGTTFPGA